MKAAYPTKKLGDLCQIARGGSPRPIQSYLTSDADGINWIKISDATASDKYIEFTKEKIRPDGLKKSRLVKPGDFILSNSMSFGRPYIMKTTGCIHDGWLVLSDKCGLFDKEYLYYFLSSDEAYRQFDKLAAGSTVRNLNSDLVKTVDVPLPPIEEQRRIVAVLDEAFAAIATATVNAEKNLAAAREAFGNWLDLVVAPKSEHDWKLHRLQDLTTKIGSGATPRGGKGSYFSEGTPLVRSLNVHDRRFKPAQLAFLDNAQAQQLSNVTLRRNDVLLNITGASVARCCILPDRLEGGRVNQHVSIIRPKQNELLPKFLELLLTSPTYKGRLLGVGDQGGSTRQAITKAQIADFQILIPPVEDQQVIADRAGEIESELLRLSQNYSRKAVYLELLKQSVLHRAFTGELGVSDTAVSGPASDNFTTPEFAAQILAFAHSRHVVLGRSGNFGHVKAQKTLHSVEAIGGLELGRRPIKDAAGPNDFAHMQRAEEWAKQHGFFEFIPRATGGYVFRKLRNYDRLLNDAKSQFDQASTTVKRALELLVDMDSDWAEIVVTTHAAWNNLILDNVTITDDAVVHAARDGWHRAKLRHDKSRFHDAIRFIRSHGIEPDGSAKRVGGQESLPL